MGPKNNEKSINQVLNWFEFKLSEHKIFKQKTQKVLDSLIIGSQQESEKDPLEVIYEMESNCETEKKMKDLQQQFKESQIALQNQIEKSFQDDLIIFSLKQVLQHNDDDFNTLFGEIKNACQLQIPKKELGSRIDSLVESHRTFQQKYFTEEVEIEDENQSQIQNLREVLDDQLKQIADLKI